MKFVNKLVKGSRNIDFILITASTIFSSMLNFLFSVYSRKYIKPIDLGIYTTCHILANYLSYLQLGTLNSYNRDYAQLLGAKEFNNAKELRETTFTFIVTAFVSAAVLVILINLLIYRGNISDFYPMGFILSSILSIMSTIELFSTYTVRMNGKFNYSAAVNMLKSLVSVCIGLFIVKSLGYYTLYIVPILSSLIAIILYYKDSISNIKLKINKVLLLNSIKTGIPLLINSLIWTVMMSVDKFVILAFMTTEDLGKYSVAIMGFSTMVLIPQSMSQVFYIKILKIYGETKSNNILLVHANKYTKIVSICTSIASIIAFYLMPIFTSLFMPNYVDGIVSSQILILGVAIYSTTMIYGNLFTILRLNAKLIQSTLSLCVISLLLSSMFILTIGRKIEYVALGSSCAYALYSYLLMILIKKHINAKLSSLFSSSWLPVLSAIASCILFEMLFDSLYIKFIASLLVTILCLLILYKKDVKLLLARFKNIK